MTLNDAACQKLEQWVAAHSTPQQVALRCRIVLAAAAGRNNVAIGEELGIDVKTVALWRARFVQVGAQGLWDIAPGRGRKPVHGPAEGEGDRGSHVAYQAARGDALELPHDG